ncbi:MAG: Fur family transcriptional regulator [Caldimicrobium sp.]
MKKDSEYILEDFREFIKKKGLKYTQERVTILKEILSINDHFDVESLYFRLKDKKSKISKASIYRTIPLLIEGGFIQEVYKQEGHSHYEVTINKKPHLHFICIRCGEVLEVMDKGLHRLIRKHEEERGYKLLTYHLEIFGLCPNCKEG